MKCKGCGADERFFQNMSFGRKQCKSCGTVHTKAQIDVEKAKERDLVALERNYARDWD